MEAGVGRCIRFTGHTIRLPPDRRTGIADSQHVCLSDCLRLCLSMSDFHPELFNPAWSVASILTGLLSFMLESTPTTGSIESSDETKRQLALESAAVNLKQPLFCELFPELVEEIKAKAAAAAAAAETSSSSSSAPSTENPANNAPASPDNKPVAAGAGAASPARKNNRSAKHDPPTFLSNAVAAMLIGVFAAIVYCVLQTSV
ncbi:ubiquitin conjugating enzyme protein 26, variant [Capsaspora owczarzaki ATCC 30864]|uniref:Ubiquitin conjugating enzyme protein 26, variant n=1 Tax=Capsaspora owczarzaki (strain ATCC 30864) TaxID=595528 RepID=A0A0D2X2K6_CAPO3|nr:ubiquitin conjugating enzyme protein 26, variant [Capsaspora owczarzaki ATCC 30864]